MLPAGRTFYKMSGSGNDFVFFDARDEPPGDLLEPGRIQRVCSRALGVGADGVVFLLPRDGDAVAAFRMRYHNSDGSLASLCGNAALCSTRLAVELTMAPAAGFSFETDAGIVSARMRDGIPEIDLQPVTALATKAWALVPRTDERRIGFAVAGVPHVVVEVPDVTQVDVSRRGAELRHDRSLAAGANVNFVSPTGDGAWRMRTFERGVEAETLACGTGAVASVALLRAWGAAGGSTTTIVTRSGRPLDVTLPADPAGHPALRGEGRLVFAGRLGELD